MAHASIKRLNRLIAIREREREKAGGEVKLSRERQHVADQQAEEAAQIVLNEKVAIDRQLKRPTTAETLWLGRECLNAVSLELVEKKQISQQALTDLKDKLEKLNATHSRVKQMTLLRELFSMRLKASLQRKEQREIDDLSALKEATRQ
ncbi:MAG: hypothetical protein QNJ97_21780 [Myxococcota bacterium]|nr:hypothetical protein [Myxococcota bacterium]